MHKLKQKKGKKTVTHHFHHVTDADGSKKHVYLGTSRKKAEDKLTNIRVARLRSQNRLIKDMETAQAKLSSIAHHQRDYDDILKDMRMRHSKHIEVEKLLNNEVKEAFPFYGYVLVFIAVMGLTAGAFFLITTPSITGAAVQSVAAIAANKIVSVAIGMLMVILILGVVLHHVDHQHRHKHDKYKPQF
jgi:hypothetical protein